MNWKNIKLGGKFGFAFGVIIVLLLFISFWSIKGIKGIIGNAEEVIDGNKLKALIIEKEVDHYQWASAVNELLNNEKVTTLNIETNPKLCGFGKWYYSEERKMAEKMIPELKQYLDAIEEPHRLLHESAIEIQQNYVNVNIELGLFLAQKRADHIEWMNQTRKEILANKTRLSVQKDPTLCELGKWMNSAETKEMAMHNSNLANFLNEMKEPHRKLHECSKIIEKHLRNDRRKEAINHLNTICEHNASSTLAHLDDMIAINQKEIDQIKKAREIYATKTHKNLVEVQRLLDKITETTSANMMTDEEMIQSASQTSAGVLFISIIITVIAIILATVITRGILRPINKGLVFARKLAEGDLTTTMDVNQQDEIGQLAQALNDMATKIRDIVKHILSGASNISSASQQIAGTSQQMSQGANEQASSLEEVTSSMEEMSANIEQNTDSAQVTEKIALNAAIGIKEGSDATNTSVSSMKDIAQKIRIINDIAFQTNILALNAAVEAARAGEHGKGFAVVAAEVRKLAERSKIAADEIDALSSEGVNISESAGYALAEIVPEIEKTAQMIQEIAVASVEQRSGAGQVSNAMQQLNNVTQQNAAASEEMATSSQELASQAQQLKETIQFFKIDSNGSSYEIEDSTLHENILRVKRSAETTDQSLAINMNEGQDQPQEEQYESF